MIGSDTTHNLLSKPSCVLRDTRYWPFAGDFDTISEELNSTITRYIEVTVLGLGPIKPAKAWSCVILELTRCTDSLTVDFHMKCMLTEWLSRHRYAYVHSKHLIVKDKAR